jgi:glycine C-acetyltransferase
MYTLMKQHLLNELQGIREGGLFKEERVILTPQAAGIRVASGEVLNFCANNYLGLSSHPQVLEAARRALDQWGYGMSSVRFICGTQQIHKDLERKLADFVGLDDAILYSSCFDANGGLFETLLNEQDAIISDQLNHASIIDGVRLCKAERFRYANADMGELESILKQTQGKRFRMIATDGVFSMDGTLAPLKDVCDLAERYDALVMVDDSHASGFMGQHGRGTHEYHGVMGRVDIITSTLGKALGGASGGFTAARQEVVDLLRQRSRPYLFSNTLPPVIAAAAAAVIDVLSHTTELRDRLEANTHKFRDEMRALGFNVKPGDHPICPIMLGDARLASDLARAMLEEGIYVVGFSYPVVPKDKARIRVQLSAAHTPQMIDRAVAAFAKVGKRFGVI